MAERPPADDVLLSAWDHLLCRPREVQAVLALIGPSLSVLLLDRLVRRGDLRRPSSEEFGSVGLHELQEGGSGRRDRVLSTVRKALVDEAEAPNWTVALAALLSGRSPGRLRSLLARRSSSETSGKPGPSPMRPADGELAAEPERLHRVRFDIAVLLCGDGGDPHVTSRAGAVPGEFTFVR
ncbi:GPP34 family phosphoprotein [Actinoplanes sp. ATCC 53533]|uniref:GPP34 family phosphoprotein n=1 Tax=Actinoplanes sp. ATCC 53533 TaxID=1288362 RepID=UPI00210357D3|nr:GPP34 family phosphoprotein [Actinoplanes sp. ATCC 53533]